MGDPKVHWRMPRTHPFLTIPAATVAARMHKGILAGLHPARAPRRSDLRQTSVLTVSAFMERRGIIEVYLRNP